MVKTMKAAHMIAPGAPLEIREIAVPEPGPGQVLVRLEVCGLCHSDLHFWKGDHSLPRDLRVLPQDPVCQDRDHGAHPETLPTGG